MNEDSIRAERWFAGVLALLGIANIILTVVASQQYVGTLVTDLLVLSLLVLAVEILARYGVETRWTIAAGVLLVVGAIGDALVTLIGFPGVPGVAPKLLWGLGLALVLYELFGTQRSRQALSHS